MGLTKASAAIPTFSGLDPDELAALVDDSCAVQGVPVRLSDPVVVRQVCALLGGPVAGSRAHPRSGSTRPAPGVLSDARSA